MKYVLVPSPVTLRSKGMPIKGPDGRELDPVTAHSFVIDYICSSQHLGKGYEGAKRASKLDRLFDGAAVESYIGVEDADHKAALQVIAAIEWRSPLIASQLLPFLDAWEHAPEKKPAEKSVNGASVDPLARAEA